MRISQKYALGGAALAVLGVGVGIKTDWYALVIALYWAALSLLVVSAGYIFSYGKLFWKRPDGRIPVWSKVLFLPFFVGTHGYNRLVRMKDSEPAFEKVTKGIYLGRRLTPLDYDLLLEHDIGAVLDSTAEFDALQTSSLGGGIDYLNLPILDHDVPTSEQVEMAIRWIEENIRNGRNVLIHCALGKGRAVILVLAYLLVKTEEENLQQALQNIQLKSPRCRPNLKQMEWLTDLFYEKKYSLTQPLFLVVGSSNSPAWRRHKINVLDMLTPFYNVDVHELTQQDDLGEVINQALFAGTEVVVSAGDDSCHSKVASFLVNRKIKFGVIPLDGPNEISRAALGGTPDEDTISLSCQTIIRCQFVEVGTFRCNEQFCMLPVAVAPINEFDIITSLIDFQAAFLSPQSFKDLNPFNSEKSFQVNISINDDCEVNTNLLGIYLINDLFDKPQSLSSKHRGVLIVNWLEKPRSALQDKHFAKSLCR